MSLSWVFLGVYIVAFLWTPTKRADNPMDQNQRKFESHKIHAANTVVGATD
jgi:hypothetical protein